MSSAVAGPSRSLSLPLQPTSPRLILHRTRRLSLPIASSSSSSSPFTRPAPPMVISRPRPPMDYFSLPLPLYDDSALADDSDDSDEEDDSDSAIETSTSQASFYAASFNYQSYRSGLQLPSSSPHSPSFGFDRAAGAVAEAEVTHLEFASSQPQLSPSSTVGSDYTLADSFDLHDFSLHSPPSSCSSFSSGHSHPQPVTPPKVEAAARPRRMAFGRYVPTPNLKKGGAYVHVDTPYPDEEEEDEEADESEDEEPRGRELQRRELVVEGQRGFELVLGLGGTLAARRGIRI